MTVEEACRIPHILQNTEKSLKPAMITYGILKKYKKGELLFRDKEEVNRFYFVIEGYAALYKLNKKQDRKVIFVYGEGEMLNEVLVDQPRASIYCEALGDMLALTFTRTDFLALMKIDFALSKAVMDSMAKKIRRLYRQLSNTSNTLYLEHRIASKLWKLAWDFGHECGGGIQISFDLSITFLAEMVGSKRETVSRVVKQLVGKDLVYVEKNTFIVPDMARLHNFCRNESEIK